MFEYRCVYSCLEYTHAQHNIIFKQVVRLLGRVKHNSHLVVNRLLEISKGSGLVARYDRYIMHASCDMHMIHICRESQLALQKIACQFR